MGDMSKGVISIRIVAELMDPDFGLADHSKEVKLPKTEFRWMCLSPIDLWSS